jgi:phthiocerol/phenolphthiocerol synthesis type-I polyketide synthase E
MNSVAGQEAVAIIGMAGRFPGAVDLGQFWAGLRGGISSTLLRSDEELLAEGVPAELLADPRYVKATALAPELDRFDAGFFGLTPRQARLCDPQARLFLECAHAALEDAGYDVEQLTNVGVFGSAGDSRYLDLVRSSKEIDLRSTPASALIAWSSADRVASLVSRQLGLHGPSLGVQADDASSLVAVHLARASLLAGECELALAGGVAVQLPLGHGYRWEPGGELSRDGSCRPFDRTASGTVLASGAGVVVLKRLSDAVADRDHIWAVLRSTAVNHDGSARADSDGAGVLGQSAVIVRAMSSAGVHPSDLSLIEAHATGNPTADRSELAALRAAFDRLDETQPERCALTSVKGNVGHLRHAAGVTSLIKVALSLANETIPANAGYRQPDPALRLDGSPFFVPDRAVRWPRQEGQPRIAGVSAIGHDGTNAHAIVTEAPAAAPVPVEQRPRIVVWSARTAEAAERYRERLAEHFAGDDAFVRSVATLQRGRTPFAHRGAVVAADAAEAASRLRDPDPASRISSSAPGQHSRIAFLFPGQGAQHAGVAQDLYEWSPSYAKAFDECLDLFEAAGLPLRRWWREGGEDELRSPLAALPLTFAVEHALTQAWQSWGITPDAVLGLSIGEMTAGAVAGVFSLPDAVQAVVSRSQAIQDSPPGGLIAVSAARAEVEPLLPGGVWIAVISGPRQLVLAGPAAGLAEATAVLEQAGLSCRTVPATRAVHGPGLAPGVPAFDRALRRLHLAPPTIGFYSAITGRSVGAAEATDPGFWSRQLAQPVLFTDALDALTATPGRLLLIEVGAGQTLTKLVRRHPTVLAGRHRALPTLADRPIEPAAQIRSAQAALATVWTEGHPVDWPQNLAGAGRTSMPGYPYDRTRHWIEPAAAPTIAEQQVASPAGRPDRQQPQTGDATADRLRHLWTTVLGEGDDIARDADFFDLGGNSLTAVELMAKVRAEFRVELGVLTLFDHSTLDALADQIDRRVG